MTLYDDITKIASGHDNTAGLTLVSALSVGGLAFLPPFTPTNYSRGQRRFTASGTPYVSGKKTKAWQSFMSLAQYTYARDTYEGDVTAYGWLENTTAYNFNAVLWFEEIADYEPINVASDGIGWAVLAVKWNFMDVQVIT
jgi:hypothetical protein